VIERLLRFAFKFNLCRYTKDVVRTNNKCLVRPAKQPMYLY